ncbi:MAG: ABC transporter ATP-binding protein [Chloroflexia bacterium]
MKCLEIEALSKAYPGPDGPIEAIRRIDLAVREGDFVAIVGPSGCGKSTLLQIVAGLEPPTSGRVLFRGRPVRGSSHERTLIFQESALFPWLTAQGNIEFGLRNLGLPAAERRERAREALRWLGLERFAGLYPHQLSGGMQQRVALARALAVDPALLLMDEPFAALDALTRRRLQEEVRRIQEARHQTVLLVTHSVREALSLADQVVVLSSRPAVVRMAVPVPRSLPPSALAEWEEAIHRSLVDETPDIGLGKPSSA